MASKIILVILIVSSLAFSATTISKLTKLKLETKIEQSVPVTPSITNTPTITITIATSKVQVEAKPSSIMVLPTAKSINNRRQLDREDDINDD
jgi:hypothetical protein